MGSVLGVSAAADVVYETDFITKSDNTPFAAGELQFNDGWLGQAGFIVDPNSPGIVSRTANGQFRRVLHSAGATGGVAGGDGSGEAGNGFSDGDVIKISAEIQYDLIASANQELSLIGFRENFVNGGFNAAPTNGVEIAYSAFNGGSLKIFTNFARSGTNGADNANALFVSGADGGFDSGNAGGTEDLSTDNLLIEYSAEYQSGFWTATSLVVTNVDTATVVANSDDKLAVLESTAYSGTEAFLGFRAFGNVTGSTANLDSISFEYEPFTETVIPEPASILLLGAGALAMLRRRR
ncbi:MAG: PEP-CTERM sorting domain-containing protein [Planctomycetota bacterium]